MKELKELNIKSIEEIKSLFAEIFTKEPWNDDWSDLAQLHEYIMDLIGNRNSKESAMEYKIRQMYPNEYPYLKKFLYEAIFQKDTETLLPKEIIDEPDLNIYIENFGKEHDHCLCAEANGRIIGAVWTRIISGYGNIDDVTPEFAISLYKKYRGKGIGTKMMQEMLSLLKSKGYKKASLSVQKENYAFKMYQNLGFKIIGETEEEFIMMYDLTKTVI
ncbi:GNAT family N-acetyltransferase [Anaerostipes caccae]|uniref:GNAT family N-acetyltransferase n=1 Tax=Anaerostipes caccae TaxID=105841 RepID=UPI002ED53784